jgi:PhnB protein
MPVEPIPEGFHTVTPYLIVEGAAKQLDFLKKAFGARTIQALTHGGWVDSPCGGQNRRFYRYVGGSSRTMEADAKCFLPVCSDTDAAYKRALEAGALPLHQPTDQVYGDRNASVEDPTGTLWWIATHIKDVSRDLLERINVPL